LRPSSFQYLCHFCGMRFKPFAILTACAIWIGCGDQSDKMAEAQSDPAFILCDSAARLFNSGGDPLAVMALLDSAYAHNPAFPLIPFNRYKVYHKMGNDTAAIRCLDLWGEMVPNNPAPPMYAGILNEKIGNDSLARLNYARALALNRLILKSHPSRDEKHDRSIIGSAICLYLLRDSVNMAPMLDSIRAMEPDNTIPSDIETLSREEIILRLL
jgi:hypothetical protein